jgi:hypothetical protein
MKQPPLLVFAQLPPIGAVGLCITTTVGGNVIASSESGTAAASPPFGNLLKRSKIGDLHHCRSFGKEI